MKPRCGAKTRSGTPCKKEAGWGTDHLGQGKCKLHGGATPVKHGRYSKINRPRIRELLDQFEHDPVPLDLLPEVKLLRALVLDFIERYDEFVDAMHAWHATFEHSYREAFSDWREKMLQQVEDEGWENIEARDLLSPPDPLEYVTKPRQVLDISAAAGLVDKVGAMVDRIEKHKQSGAITISTLDRVLEAVGVELVAALREEVTDEALRTRVAQAFERRWSTVRIDSPGSTPARTHLVN